MRLFILLLLHVVCVDCLGQLKSVSGHVTDTSGTPISNVNVSLVSNSANTSVKTNKAGEFNFGSLASSVFQLTFSIIGYETFSRSYAFDQAIDKAVSIEAVRLKISIKDLPEVVLNPVNPVTVKEDTIEYRADAYKVRQGAMAEDLLKKLPGVLVNREGSVTAQGKEVTRVRVNGKDYFGGDILTATRNLPADIIENIQLIEEYGEKGKHTGIKEGEPEKILNINIKKGRDNGSFGNATVVAGTKNRFLTSVAANNFKGEKQVSFVGSFNNTNSSSFDFGGARDNGGRGNMPGSSDRGAVGVSRQTSAGFNYRNSWGKKVSSFGSYSFASRENTTVSESFQQDINAQNISSIKSSNQNTSDGRNHRLNWNLEYKFDTLNYVKVSPYFSSASSENNYRGNAQYARPAYSTQSIGNTVSSDVAPGWGTDIFYVHRFDKPRRNFNISASMNQTSRQQDREAKNTYYHVDSSYSPFLATYNEQNQVIASDNRNTTSALRLSFVEPLQKNTSLEINYAWSRSGSKTLRDVNDVDQRTGEKTRNVSQSNDYNFQFTTNRIGANYFRYEKKYNYSIGIAAQPTLLIGTDVRRNVETRNANFNLVPSVRFVYKLPRNQSLTATYGGSSREPGFTQLQPVSDSSNLLTIIKGNPSLRPEFTNRFRLQFSKVGVLTGGSLFANISFDKTQNKIVTSRTNEAVGTGRMLSYVNTDGFYGFTGNVSASRTFAKKHLVLSFNTVGNFDNNLSFTDNQKNSGYNWSVRPEVMLRLDVPDKMDIAVGAGYSYNKNTTRYSTYTYSSQVQTLSLGINGKNYFLKDWTLGYDLTRNVYIGYLKSFNSSPTLLSVFAERRFLKNNKGLLRVQGFDLFDQNSGIVRNVNGTTITDLQSNRLTRYFLLSFNYRLQKFGGK